jgi:F0F1-type ATP synthase membrane subunit b/b'
MARLLGEAYIAILPDTSQFGPTARADLDKAVAAIKPQADVGAQLNKADVAKIGTQLKAITKANPINVGVNLDKAAAARMVAQLTAYTQGHTVQVGASISAADLGKMQTQLQAFLSDKDLDVGLQLNPAQLAKMQGSYDAFVRELNDNAIDPNVNILPALSRFALLKSANDSLRAFIQSQNAQSLDFNIMPALAKIAEVKAAEESLAKVPFQLGSLNSVGLASAITSFSTMGDRIAAVDDYLQRTGEEGTESFNALTAAVKDTGDQFLMLQAHGIGPEQINDVRSMDAAIKSLEADTGLASKDAGDAAQGFGILGRAIAAIKNTHIDLFGGALTSVPLPNFLTQASGLHMLVEGVVELTAVWGPLIVAVTAFGALAYTTGKDIYTQYMNMNTVVEATGEKFADLKGGIQSLENDIKPEVMQLFGDYLTVAGNSGSHFAGVMEDVGRVLDDFGAKIAMDLNSKSTSTFLDKASSDLAGVGDAFEQLGRIIHTLLEAVPGYAQLLLKFGDGFLTIAANATAGLEPAIAMFLKLHGAIFYLGLATTAILTFGRSFAAAAIAKGAAGLSDSFTGMAESANRWAEDFTSDNEKVSEAAGNSGSKLGTWAQGIGGLFGNLINGSIKVGAQLKDMFAILTGSATVTGLTGGIQDLESGLNKLVSTGKVTTDGVEALQAALTGLRSAGTDAAGIEVLNTAINSLKDSGESAAAVETLQGVLQKMQGGEGAEGAAAGLQNLGKSLGGSGGLADDAEDAAGGTSRFTQVLSKLPGLGLDAEGGMTVFGTALAALPILPIVAGVALLGTAVGVGLYLAFHKSATAADILQASLTKMVDVSNLADVQNNIAKAIGETTQAMAEETKALDGINAAASKNLGTKSSDLVNPQDITNINNLSRSFQQNEAALTSWENKSITVGNRTGALSSQFGGLTGAMTIMNLAGVKQSDVVTASASAWAEDEQKINATAQAYGFMNQASSTTASNLDVLNISTGNVTKAVQSLTAAQSAWATLITGGDSGFTTFEQGQATLVSSLKGVKGGLAGISASALTARAAFDSQLQAGVTLYGNLEQLSAASGQTAKSQGQVAAGGKAIVASLIPIAGSSKEAAAELYAIAKSMGYIGPNNLKSITQWAGNARDATSKLNQAQTALTISSANLTQAAKNLGNAILNEVTQMEAAKVASGTLESAVNGLFNNFKNAKGAVNQAAVSLSGEYVNALVKAGASQSNATQMLNAYLKSLGYTPGEIKAIDSQLGDSTKAWNDYTKAQQANAAAAKTSATMTRDNASAFASLDGILPGSVTQLNNVWAALVKQDAAMVTSGKDATGAKAQFLTFAEQGLGVTTSAAQALWAKFGQQNLDYLASHASNTKAQFISFAQNGLHLTTEQAQTLWGEFAQQNLDMIVTKGNNAKNSFIALAKNGLNLTTSQANTLWNTLKQQYLDTLAAKAGETETAFAKTASQFGLTTTAADTLWNKLKTLAGGSPYNVSVNETLSGKGKITAAISATSVAISSGASSGVGAPLVAGSNSVLKAAASSGGKAAGWQVPAGGTPAGQDGYHAILAPGELVIPTSHAPAFGDMARKAGIPGANGHRDGIFLGGMDAGGFATTSGQAASTAAAGVPTMQQAAEQFTANAMSAFASDVNTAFTNAQNAATAGAAWDGQGGANLLTIAKYLMANGMNRGAAAGIAATIGGESVPPGNPESRNCVPLTYKVVTNRGVLSHDEVRVGDTTEVYWPITGRVETAVILDVPYHYGADMVRIGNGTWSVECTNDHKWITERGLVRADQLTFDDKLIVGEGRVEPVNFYEYLGEQDSFCLTTTTGTWTTVTDEGDVLWTGNSGGWGLIGWTGNTVGLPAGFTGPTGNVNYDMGKELQGVIGYMNARGGRGPLNAAGNVSPVQAGDVWSRYEAPKDPLSDTRPALADQLYAELGGGTTAAKKAAVTAGANAIAKAGQKPHTAGGTISEPVYGFGQNSGMPYSFAENGPEMITPGMDTGGNDNYMQPITQTQGMTIVNLLQTLAQQGQQLPYALTKVQQAGLGAGMRSNRS